MARKTKEDALITQHKILEAALELFSQKGYSKVTFDNIAKSIDLTKGAVYWHFKNKAELLLALIIYFVQIKNKDSFGHLSNIAKIEDIRTCFVLAARKVCEDIQFRKFLHFIFFQIEWSTPLYKNIQNTLDGIRELPLTQLKDSLCILQKNGDIDANINVDTLAVCIFAMWQGLLQNEVLHFHSKQDFPKLVEKSFSIIVKGLENANNNVE